MASYFLGQGYPKRLVENQRLKARSLKRSDLLAPKTRQMDGPERVVIPIDYHERNLPVINVLQRNFPILENDDEVGDLFDSKPMVAYRRDRNLKDILVRSRLKRGEPQNAGTKNCNKRRCLTCNHITNDLLVVGPRGTYRVTHQFTCESKELIYCINCKKCGQLYVGETCRMLKERFREHRRNVLNGRRDNEVATHFNDNGHSVEDMGVMGIKYQAGNFRRKLEEQRIIGKLGCMLGGGMNTDFNFPQLAN